MKIKFLIIRLSSIGDIVLTSPVVRCLKQQVEGSEVHFVIKQKHAVIALANPYIDKIHVYKNNMGELLKSLENEKFDHVINLHTNFRSNRIKRSLKAPYLTFDKQNFNKFLFTKFKVNRLPNVHIVDRYFKTVRFFDVENDGKGLDFFIPEDENFDFRLLPEKFANGFIAFVIGGTYFTKRLPPEKIIEICNLADFPVILLGGRNEKLAGDFVVSNSKANVQNYAGKLTLCQSASVIREAKIVLTNDTGLMHVAAAFKKKILSFWGNTVPAFGMTPYMPHPDSKILEADSLKCRPCSKLGYHKCPKKHFACMREISSKTAADWISEKYGK